MEKVGDKVLICEGNGVGSSVEDDGLMATTVPPDVNEESLAEMGVAGPKRNEAGASAILLFD